MFLGLNEDPKKKYRVQETPLRDEIGIKMANQIISKKRHQKQSEKIRMDAKLLLGQEAAGEKVATPVNPSFSEAGKKLLTSIIREKSTQRNAPQTPLLFG